VKRRSVCTTQQWEVKREVGVYNSIFLDNVNSIDCGK
jgi:hypothetical protein